MSRVLDWIENIGDAIILLLLSLGVAFPKKPTTLTEIYEQEQLISELINIYGKIIETYLHNQSIYELYRIPNEISLYPPLLSYDLTTQTTDLTITPPLLNYDLTTQTTDLTVTTPLLSYDLTTETTDLTLTSPSLSYDLTTETSDLSLSPPTITYEVEITT